MKNQISRWWFSYVKNFTYNSLFFLLLLTYFNHYYIHIFNLFTFKHTLIPLMFKKLSFKKTIINNKHVNLIVFFYKYGNLRVYLIFDILGHNHFIKKALA